MVKIKTTKKTGSSVKESKSSKKMTHDILMTKIKELFPGSTVTQDDGGVYVIHTGVCENKNGEIVPYSWMVDKIIRSGRGRNTNKGL